MTLLGKGTETVAWKTTEDVVLGKGRGRCNSEQKKKQYIYEGRRIMLSSIEAGGDLAMEGGGQQ